MDSDDLEALLRDVESFRAERTIERKGDKIGEAICAFANDLPGRGLPGYIFVGASPDGTACGLAITEQLLESLAAFRSDGNILPAPVMTVEKRALGGGEMAVVKVLPSDLPPVRYKGRIWVRIAPRRAWATESEERILNERRTSLAKTWDARPCAESSVDELILDVFTLSYRRFAVAGDVIEENHRTIDEQLAALRFFDARAARPTNAGVLLFGRDPVYFLPGAYVQHVRYDGTTLADEVSRERRFEGDLLTVLRGLDSLAEDLAETRPEPLPSGGDQLVHAYPPRTLHELLMNAVIHRNYDGSTTPVLVNHFTDRVEIQSPGGLYGDLTAARFPGGTSYRNPIVAEAAKVLGFVNRFGRGIAIAQALLAKNGSRPAEFDVGSNHLSVTIWRRR